MRDKLPPSPPHSTAQTPDQSPPEASKMVGGTGKLSYAATTAARPPPSPISPRAPMAVPASSMSKPLSADFAGAWKVVDSPPQHDGAASPLGSPLEPEGLSTNPVSEDFQHRLSSQDHYNPLPNVSVKPPTVLLNGSGHLDDASSRSSGGATANWGTLGLQWGAGPSIWNGTASGISPSNEDRSSATRFSNNSGMNSKAPVGHSPASVSPPTANPNYRQSRSLSFSIGQQDTDFFGSIGQHGNVPFARRGQSGAAVVDGDDFSQSSVTRDLNSGFRQSLPSMSEENETYGNASTEQGHLGTSPSAGNAAYTSFTLPKLRSRSKSSAAAYGVLNINGLPVAANNPGSNALGPNSYPSSNVPAETAFNNRHRDSIGSVSGLSSSLEDGAPYNNSIWREDKGSSSDSKDNQHRRSITTPTQYWSSSKAPNPNAPVGRSNEQYGGNGNHVQDMLDPSSTLAEVPGEQLERVRIQRRFSLNPAMTGINNANGGLHDVNGVNNHGIGAGDHVSSYGSTANLTGNYGEYKFLESGQGLGMHNRVVEPEYAHLNQRRHSVAGPTLSFGNANQSRYLNSALDGLSVDDSAIYGQSHGFKSGMEETSLDDYFDNDEPRAARVAAAAASVTFGNGSASLGSAAQRSMNGGQMHSHSTSRDADAHLGKGVPLHAVPHHGPLFIIEFKAGRSDLFYLVPDSTSEQIKKGDLVIVEADRGKDLGKVMNDNITPIQVQMLQQQQAEAAAVAEMGMSIIPGQMNGPPGLPTPTPVKELHPKRIYRVAQPAEVTMLVAKSQDEAKAMVVCQTKVRQKNLPMEVVDAEYQWDRRKLTFYFIADRRIDFRELVRDLFKIYKTRIWMCAVNPNMNSGVGLSSLKR